MAGLSVYLSVVSAVFSHSSDGWIRLKRRWGGTHGDVRTWTSFSPQSHRQMTGTGITRTPSLTLHGHSSSGTPGRVRWKRLPLNLRPPPPSPPPPLHLTAGRQKVITPWILLDPDWIIKPILEIVATYPGCTPPLILYLDSF